GSWRGRSRLPNLWRFRFSLAAGCDAMTQTPLRRWFARNRLSVGLGLLVWVGILLADGRALSQIPAAEPEPLVLAPLVVTMARQALSLDGAIRWALANNPELAAMRKQHGVAAAGVVIARTYPFNPIWEGRVQAAAGPESAAITNGVPTEHLV